MYTEREIKRRKKKEKGKKEKRKKVARVGAMGPKVTNTELQKLFIEHDLWYIFLKLGVKSREANHNKTNMHFYEKYNIDVVHYCVTKQYLLRCRKIQFIL